MSFAATDTLSVVDGSGLPGDQVEVQVALTNAGRIAGTQFDLVADRERLRWRAVRCVARAVGMEVHSQVVGDTLRVVLLDPGRRGAVAAGFGPILSAQADLLAASGEVRIGLGRAKVADDGRPPQAREAAAKAGRLLVLSNLLSLRDGEGTALVLLSNADRVAAAQFDLVYDPAEVSVAQVRLSARCAGLAMFEATASAGRTRVVAADLRGEAWISPGEGAMVEVLFRSRRVSSGTGTVPVQIEGAVLSGPGGAPVPVGARGGTVSVTPRQRPRVVIEEALADPPDGPAGDANGDGVRDAYQDEFVEVLNADTMDVDMGGWALSDDDTPAAGRFRFPKGTVLRPGERAVLFGGGRPAGLPGHVFVDDGRVGDGLSNTGDLVLLTDTEGDTISTAGFGGADGQSLVRLTEGVFAPHADWPGRGAFSPGRGRPVASGLRVAPEAVTLRRGESASLRAVAAFSDGVEDTVRAGLMWSSDRPEVASVEESGKVTGMQAGAVRVTARIGELSAEAGVRVEESPRIPPVVTPPPPVVTPPPPVVTPSPPVVTPPPPVVTPPPPVVTPSPPVVTPSPPVVTPSPPVVTSPPAGIPPAAPAPNRPPAIETASLRPARAGGFYQEQIVAADADGDRMTFSMVFGPGWLGVDAGTGVLSGRPAPGWTGEVGVEVQVEDGRGGVARRSYLLTVLPRRRVVIEEALADPPGGLAGDANGDGVRETYQDEFIEVLNADTVAVDVSGWTLSDDDVSVANRFRFPPETILRPGERAVLFGGGRPAGASGRVFVDDGRVGDGLSNAGEKALLFDPQDGDTVDVVALPKAEGQSLVRLTEGRFVPHGDWPGRGAFSPGRGRPVASGLRIAPEGVRLRPGGSELLRAVATFTDGVEDTVRAGLAWSSDRPEVAAVEGGGRVSGLRTGVAMIRVNIGELSAQVEVGVEPPPNRPPALVTSGLRPARAGVFYREQVVAADADGDRLRFSLTDGPGWLGVDAGTGVLSGRPERAGEVAVEVQVEDGRGEGARRSYPLTVLPRRRVVIDEALTDPPGGLAGDANGDGVRETYQDEFIEVLNADTAAVEVGGWTLSDDDVSVASRFRFPPGTILRPGERAVLFGGGRPAGVPGRVFVDDGRIGDGLSNAGEKVLLFDPQEGDTVDVVALPKAEGQSLVRPMEGVFAPHGAWPGRGAFSPGRGRPLLQGIAAEGDSSPMRPGERRGIRAVAVYSDSGMEEVTDRVTWVEGDTSVARLEGRGIVRAIRPGQADFVARWGYVASPPYKVKVVPFENRPPAMAALPDTAALEDSPLRLRARASDPDGDEVRFSLAHGPAWLSIDPGSGLISGVPDDPDVGVWEVTAGASDGRLAVSRTFRVTVRNRPPSFGDPPRRRGRVGVGYRDTLRVHNLDGGTVRLTDGPPGLGMEGALLGWRPSASGRWSVTALAQDPHGGEATLSWEVEALPLPLVVVDEVLADPPRGAAGDANGDGRGDGGEDEFIELLNAGHDAAALGGLTLGPEGTSGSRAFRFPEGTAVPPGGRLLLFGGGAPGDFPCPVFVDGGRIGRGLSADGGVVLLTDPAGPDTLLRAAFPGRSRGQSWVRHPSASLRPAQESGRDGPVTQGQDAFALHGDLPGRGRFSPGRPRPLLIGLSVAAETTMAVGKRRPFKVMGIFNDGAQEIVTEGVTIITSDTSVLRTEGDDRLVGVGEGRSSVRAWFEDIEGVAGVRVVPGRGILAGGRSPAGGPQPDRVLSQVGTPPVQDTVAVGGDYRLRVESEASVQWTVVEGPAWLAVEPETGDLVGSPPGEGIFQVILSGEDSTGQAALVVVTLTARPEAGHPERGPPEEGPPGDDVDELEKKIHRRKGEADSDEAAVPGARPGGADPPSQGRPAEGGEVALVSNYPNPFNETTVLRCRSPTPGRAEVYTLLGQCVRRWAEVGAAETLLVWDGRDGSGRALPSGVYFLVFEAEGVRAVRRMTLIR